MRPHNGKCQCWRRLGLRRRECGMRPQPAGVGVRPGSEQMYDLVRIVATVDSKKKPAQQSPYNDVGTNVPHGQQDTHISTGFLHSGLGAQPVALRDGKRVTVDVCCNAQYIRAQGVK